jgi:LAO/AO transport system kinase
MAGVPPADPALVAGVLAGDRRCLAKAITLVESTRRDHQQRGQAVLEALLPHAGRSIRVGISGAPGVGKSTFVEALGLHLIGLGHRLAVLAVDPSSSVSGGSILGDKTRMEELSRAPQAFIRPSPAGRSLGGVAARTREALLVCEAAGFDVIVVETVGVGQSETAVARMTDLMVLLQLPIAGDELQAIKKGIVELADLIVVNKADLAPERAAEACNTLKSALSILRPSSPHWRPQVLALSALAGKGIPAFWDEVERFRATMQSTGEFAARRRDQACDWMWHLIDERLRADFRAHPGVGALLASRLAAVAAGRVTPAMAAEQLLARAREDA